MSLGVFGGLQAASYSVRGDVNQRWIVRQGPLCGKCWQVFIVREEQTHSGVLLSGIYLPSQSTRAGIAQR